MFSEVELSVLQRVAAAFKQVSTNHIVGQPFKEAWKSNEKSKGVISYEYAFELNPIL